MATATKARRKPAGGARREPRQADYFVAFGISGDLAKVMTFNSLYRLEARGLLNCPIVGVAAPLLFWGVSAAARFVAAFVLRWFAGFCLLANGLYVGAGSFGGIGDCGDMLRHGSDLWHLWLFGVLTAPAGLWLWHNQGPHFGLGAAGGRVNRNVAYGVLLLFLALLVLALVVNGQ